MAEPRKTNPFYIDMTIIDKYLALEIFKYIAIVLTAVVSIYVIVDLFENMDNFRDAGLPMSRVFTFLITKLPFIIAQVLPVSLLLGVLITFGLMNRNNEMIALKSGGLSVYYFLRPVLSIGLFISLLLFFLSEVVVPITIGKANTIWRVEVKQKSAVTTRQKNIWIKGHRSIYFISYFNPRTKMISGVTLNRFNDDFKLIRRIDAQKGKYRNGNWVLYGIMEQVLDERTMTYSVNFHEEQIEEIDFIPDDLQRLVKKSEEMNFGELHDYILDVESEGYDATPYRVDLYAKFALPFACLILSIIATGLSVKRRLSEGLAISIALGIGTVFLYWVFHSFCISLGYGGMLPPVIAAWVANIIFLSLGFFSLLNVE